MNVLFLSPSDMLTEPVISGLYSLNKHAIEVCRYDRIGVPVDQGMLDAVDLIRPDIVLYIGQNGGPYLASTDTFERIRKHCPTVFLLFDGVDTTWLNLVSEYRKRDVFTVTVNIDGNDGWEKGPKDFTALTPTDPRFYRDQKPLLERPIKFGFAGGYASPSRAEVVNYLIEHAGLVVPRRNEKYGSYQAYADFMMSCQIVLNVPFTGSDNSTQVKGRVIEAGLAGCVLLEHESSVTKRWFDMGRDYVPYNNQTHASDIANDLLKAKDMTVKKTMTWFSGNLHKSVAEHSPTIFWNKVFERAFS